MVRSAATRAAAATTTARRIAGTRARTTGARRGTARSRFARVRELGGIDTVFRIGSHAGDQRTAAGTGVGRTTTALRRRSLRRSAAGALLARIAVLVELDELVFTHGDGRGLR